MERGAPWSCAMRIEAYDWWSKLWKLEEIRGCAQNLVPKLQITGSHNPKSPRTIGRGLQRRRRAGERKTRGGAKEEAKGPLSGLLMSVSLCFFEKVGWAKGNPHNTIGKSMVLMSAGPPLELVWDCTWLEINPSTPTHNTCYIVYLYACVCVCICICICIYLSIYLSLSFLFF